MGGVSSSQLVADGEAVSFEGTLREEGGGFCGQRLKLLTEPLDLSAQAGLYVDCEPEAECTQRVWKLTCRARQDRGEVVYQATLNPQPLQRQRLFVPWSDFQLVRGPRLVPGMPPLSVADVNATYQVSLVVSKFTVSASGDPLDGFLPGRFRLRIFSLGAGGAAAAGDAAAASDAAAAALPPAMTEEQQKASQPFLIRLLRPVLGLIFGETRRRRRAATLLLQARGFGPLKRARYGWALKRAGGQTGYPSAVARTLASLSQDTLALLISLPARGLFKIVVTIARAARWLRTKLGGAAPKMPPLSTA